MPEEPKEESTKDPRFMKKVLQFLDDLKKVMSKLKEIAKDIPILIGSLGFGGAAIANFFGYKFGMGDDEDEWDDIAVEIEEGSVSLEKPSDIPPHPHPPPPPPPLHKPKPLEEDDDFVEEFEGGGHSKGGGQFEQEVQQKQQTTSVQTKEWYQPYTPDNYMELGLRLGVQFTLLIFLVWAWKRFHKNKNETDEPKSGIDTKIL